eukprot:TRINITY_DN7485_c0_g1_i1.p1 TRINITY_DN7485_c0_g1~~TRINITY_DN7485_c0_g1_i1.p1  ORF type:complete len:225 (-),score=39.45 TRINITY_DN7485_c0_g1_i1:209-883(-)
MSTIHSQPGDLQAKPQRSIWLSATAEQRWRQLTGGRHLISAVPGLLEEEVQNNVSPQLQPAPPLAQALGFADRRKPMYEQCEGDLSSNYNARLVQQAVAVGGSHEEHSQTRGGAAVSAVRPSRQLLEEMFLDPRAPPLPASLQRLAATPFVPPDGEEWQLLNGWHVRISRAEMDQLLAQAEASESGEDDVDSLAETASGLGSDRNQEDRESAHESEKSSDEMCD